MSRRRFRIGQHEVYDRKFDNRKRASQILNPLGHQVSWQVFGMGDESGLTSLLREYKSNLQNAEDNVAKAEEQFEQLRVMCANAGRAVPKERDGQIQVEYLDTLAAMDVAGEEVDKLEGMLAKVREQRRAVEASKILRCGPCGTGKMGVGNVLCVLDGQKISQNPEHILVIDEPGSPYNGMAVEDYRKYLVLPWLDTHSRFAVDRASLPPWPEEVPRPDSSEKKDSSHRRR